jgi:hypothetical protein
MARFSRGPYIWSQCRASFLDDRRERGNDDEHVADEREDDGDLNRLELSKVLIGNVALSINALAPSYIQVLHRGSMMLSE